MSNRNKYSELMISIRKIVRAVNLESKRIEKDFGLSIAQVLTLKFLKETNPLIRYWSISLLLLH